MSENPEADFDTRNDDAAQITAFMVDGGDGGGCPHVKNNQGSRIVIDGSHGVNHPVRTQGCRIVHGSD